MEAPAQVTSNEIATVMKEARSGFQNGNLDAAKAACRFVLDAAPTNAEAWYYLGLIAYRQGGKTEALDCLRSATEHDPAWAEACNHYGNALREHGRLDEALEKYRQASGLKSNYAPPYYNIGLVLVAQGRAGEAEESFRKALDIDPDFVEAWNSLGLLLHNQDKSSEAVVLFRESLRRSPENVEALNNMGLALIALKQGGEAVELCRKALAVAPGRAEVHNTLGLALREAGKMAEAALSYRQALECNPACPEAYNNLAQIHIDGGQLEEAEDCCRKALSLRPSYPEALNNLGIVLKESGRFAEAEECCRRSLALYSSNPDALNNLGIILRDRGSTKEARATLEAAIALQPACAVPWFNLGLVRRDQGNLEEEINCYQQALKYRPDYSDALNNLGATLTRQGRIEEALAVYRRIVTSDAPVSYAHSSLLLTMQYSPRYSSADIFLESRRWDELYGSKEGMQLLNVVDSQRQLRIGYVSPDFRRHSVSYFLRALFGHHSRTEMMIVCYSDVPADDEYTDYFRSSADLWRNTARLGDEEVSRLVNEDKIDILVDLAAHTGKRLTLFTRKIAPIQVTWLGYPDTTGLSSIDYRISDDIADPVGESDRFHSEKLCRLPGGFLCYTPPADAPDVAPLPTAAADYITFGSFNSIAKITPEVVVLWSHLLRRIPEARLVVKTHSLSDGATARRYAELFALNGIATGRVDLRPWEQSTASHLSVYGEIDIALDTFPYNGTTTTCEALWMGVPVVTLSGDRHAGRVGASILTRVGFADLIAASADEYLRIAENLAHDKSRLVRIRATLREDMQASPLCDGAAFARTIEGAFRRMWHGWCASRSHHD